MDFQGKMFACLISCLEVDCFSGDGGFSEVGGMIIYRAVQQYRKYRKKSTCTYLAASVIISCSRRIETIRRSDYQQHYAYQYNNRSTIDLMVL